MIVIHSNFSGTMHGFRVNKVLLLTVYDVIVSPPQIHANFHDIFWKSDDDFLIAYHRNFLSRMHGFRDYEVLFKVGYDVIAISPPGGASCHLYDGFRKIDHDFLSAFHSNFLSGMHGFRDNEVLLQAGYNHEFLIVFHSKFYLRCNVS